MANESNDKNNLTRRLRAEIQKSVRKSFDKNIGGKSKTENAGIRDFERNVVDNVNEYKNTEGTGSEKAKNFARKRAVNERDKYLQKQGALGDFNELRRLNSMPQASQEEQIKEIREEVKEEAKRETERMSKHVKSAKGRIALKLAGEHLDKLAFVISQKMAEQAKAGGIHAMFAIGLTYLIAIIKDLLDATGIGSIVGILTGIIAAAIIGMFWVQVCGGWKGGIIKKRLIRKILIKILISFGIEAVPGVNIIPTFVIINIWSHLDYIGAKRKAKSDLRSFNSEYKTNKMAVKDYWGKYVGS